MTSLSIVRALTLHREAFASESRRDFDQAAPLFDEALAALARACSEPALRAALAARAARLALTAEVDPDAVAGALVTRLPRWLLEAHFERLSFAFSRGDVVLARFHWGVLTRARALAAAARGYDLDVWRSELVTRFVGEDALVKGDEERAAALEKAELVLQLDPGNTRARQVARRGYSHELALCLDLLRDSEGRTGAGGQTRSVLRLPRRSVPRTQVRMERAARRLLRHLRALRREGGCDPKELGRDFAMLAVCHAATGNLYTALICARKARRLDPDSNEIRALVRKLHRRNAR